MVPEEVKELAVKFEDNLQNIAKEASEAMRIERAEFKQEARLTIDKIEAEIRIINNEFTLNTRSKFGDEMLQIEKELHDLRQRINKFDRKTEAQQEELIAEYQATMEKIKRRINLILEE